MSNCNPTQAEIWRPVPGYEGIYEVSNLGRVKGVDRIVRHNCGGDKFVSGKILSPLKLRNGYYQIALWSKGHRKVMLLHKIVLLAFKGECPQGLETMHLNSDRADNRLSNLLYGTHSENTIETIRLGRNGKQRLNPSKVIAIRDRLQKGEKVKSIAKIYEVSERAISQIKNGHTYSWVKESEV